MSSESVSDWQEPRAGKDLPTRIPVKSSLKLVLLGFRSGFERITQCNLGTASEMNHIITYRHEGIIHWAPQGHLSVILHWCSYAWFSLTILLVSRCAVCCVLRGEVRKGINSHIDSTFWKVTSLQVICMPDRRVIFGFQHCRSDELTMVAA